MIATASPTLEQFLHTVYVPRHLGIKPKTVTLYGYSIRSIEAFWGRTLLVSELAESTVLPWLSARSQEVAPKTVHRERGDILTLWRFAARRGLCDHSPDEPRVDIPPVKLPERTPTAWRPEELSLILSAARNLRGRMKGTEIDKAVWWPSLILFLYHTGTRIGAALAVRTVDVDLGLRLVMLRHDTAKTRVEQALRLHPQVCEAVAKHFDASRQLVWPYHYHPRTKFDQLKRLLRRAGLPSGRDRAYHCLRRTCYTHTARFGGREMAARQLGHKTDLSRFYLDPRQIDEQQAADVLPSLSF